MAIVVLTRRRFIAEGAALLATGALVGGGAVIAASALRQPVPSGTTPPGASAPAGLEPTAPGTTDEPIASSPPEGPGRAVQENLRRGTDAWLLPLDGKGDAEAYMGDVSVAAGEQLTVHVSASLPEASITLYRLGWYAGQGARVVGRWRDVAIDPQPLPSTDARTGLIQAGWSPAVSAVVPDGWVSGLYVAVISPVGGSPQYCTFVVRERSPQAPILVVSSTTTHQAYNPWGGKSLYPGDSSGATTVSGDTNAVIASWDRPYAAYRGAGLVLRWEYPFARWVESRGYDVAYVADLDLDRHPELLGQRRVIVFAGHPEYWSAGMRRTLESAIAAGTNVAFFSANEMYWRVRYDDEAGGRYRSVTCYRRAELDPVAALDPQHATTKWREQPAPNPESLVVGQMYGHIVLKSGDFVCAAPSHWLYDGTGMNAGDGIKNLVGQEYDRYWTEPGLAPANTEILAVSPVRPNLGYAVNIYGPPPPNEPWPPVHNATMYSAPSGATVFAAGTMQWSWALDGWGNPGFEGTRTPIDPRVARMSSNVLDRLGS